MITELLDSQDTTIDDLLRLLIGNQVGRGCSREVFELRDRRDLVVKIEKNSYDFQNINEWNLWGAVLDTDQEHWLAPLHAISPCGICLLMSRTEPLTEDRLPKFIPEWLTDTKLENWGWYQGRAVCHDYGFNTALGITRKVVRAEWL